MMEIDDLQRHILETSLIYVLTAKTLPEIGAFLHLPRMPKECVEELDQYIVGGFTDALIRLVVIGSLEKEPGEDFIKDFIEGQIHALGRKHKQGLGALKEKWENLKKRVLDSSTIGATSWSDLERHYRDRIGQRVRA